ncbi:MAG: resuscitation-promoting factor RpfA [Frankiaceae bacterium]|nr:resuscitation-promoting factor RpfA [Frankiaceae bacterium]
MPPTPAYVGRHRRVAPPRPATRTGARLVAAAAFGGVVAASVALPTLANAATANDFARLRMCESSGNYSINTGNGYYGAYQFDLQTWHGLGYAGRPDQASARTQDEAARRLQAQRGWSPWPSCSRSLGLGTGGGSDRANRSSHRAPLPVRPHVAFQPVRAPAFHGVVLRTALVGSVRADVRAWQAQMQRRGWVIAVDGMFGPQSSAVARAFQVQQHRRVTGAVDAPTWRLAWEAHV